MTPFGHLAERYGDPVRGEATPLEDWTELEQAHHRAELVAADKAYEAGRRKAPNPRPPRPKDPRTDPAVPGMPNFANQRPPAARKAKGTTLEELLTEDWGT